MAIGDHLVTRRQSGFDNQAVTAGRQHLDATNLDRLVGLGHIDEAAVRSGLQRLGRHHNGADDVAQGHRNFKKLARCQALVGIVEFRLHQDRAGARIHRVVDEHQFADDRRPAIARQSRLDLELLADAVAVDFRQLVFRHRKSGIDRAQLVDHHQAGVAGLDAATGKRQYRAGDAIHRRGDGGVAQLHLGQFERRLVGLDGGLQGIDGGAKTIERGGGNEALGEQVGVACEIGLGLVKLGPIARQIGLALLNLCLQCPCVKRHQRLAAAQMLAGRVLHADDLAVDPRLESHRRQGFGAPHHVEAQWHIALLDRSHCHRRRPRRCAGGLGGTSSGNLALLVEVGCTACNSYKNNGDNRA